MTDDIRTNHEPSSWDLSPRTKLLGDFVTASIRWGHTFPVEYAMRVMDQLEEAVGPLIPPELLDLRRSDKQCGACREMFPYLDVVYGADEYYCLPCWDKGAKKS